MRRGHVTTLIGTLLVLLGGTALPWQRFELAGVSARGFEVPLVAQIVLALAGLIAAAAALGLGAPRSRLAPVTTLTGAIFLLGWVSAAHVTRASGLPLMPGEVVTMGAGYVVAVAGSVLTFLGALAAALQRRR